MEVRFASADGECAAWLTRPPASRSAVPCVVMGNGATLTRHDGLPAYAERFTAAGAAALAFDYRHFGDSPGEPRQQLRIRAQRCDLQAAVAFARGQDGIDPDRIVLWGFSIAGGYVLQVAAADRRTAAVLAVFPLLDLAARALATPARDLARLLGPALRDRLGRPRVVAATGPPGARAVLTRPGEAEGFARVVAPGSPWRNELSPGALLSWFRPVTTARRVAAPLWVSLGERDVSVPSTAIERLAERAPHAELRRYPCDHFDALAGAQRDRIADDQVSFLRRTGVL